MTKLKTAMFSGAGNVHNGTLAAALIGIAQFQSANIAKALADITDSSTGTSGANTAAAVPIPALFTSVGTDAAPKAGTETALGTHKNALTTMVAAANVILVAIGLAAKGAATGGTDGAGTVAAMTKTVTAVAGSAGTGVNGAGGIADMIALRNDLHRLVRVTNEVAQAVGLPLITNNVGGEASSLNFSALSTDTGTAATAPQAAALGTLSKVGVDAFLLASANVIATCAAKLNAATDTARVVKPTVHAAL
jgi:hypothetical protein